MTHPDEGTIVALRDGEAIPETDRAHIAACIPCSTALDEARARAAMVERFLDEVSEDVDIAAAKAAVRERLDRDRAGRRSPLLAVGLGRAAAILLVAAAGAAAALPSSPVRDWIVTGLTELRTDAVSAPAASSPASETRSIGVAAMPGLVIALAGADADVALSVLFESRDAVEVSAADGTRFSIAETRVEASEVAGPVVIRVPLDAPPLTVTLGGRMMFTGTATIADVAPSGVRTTDGWVFGAAGR